MVNEAVRAALADAAMTIDEIDAVLLGNMEFFENCHMTDCWLADGSGAYGRPGLKITTGGTVGATIVGAAALHVASGLFDTELKTNGRFVGIRCPRCGRVQLPPRIVCAVCHVPNREWVVLGQEGCLVGFTIMHIPLTDPTTGKPHRPPFAYGSVRLDGADSVIDHFIDVAPDMVHLRVGMRLRAVLRPATERRGDLSDILHFTPLPGQRPPAAAQEVSP